jgi:hypothetical protein
MFSLVVPSASIPKTRTTSAALITVATKPRPVRSRREESKHDRVKKVKGAVMNRFWKQKMRRKIILAAHFVHLA